MAGVRFIDVQSRPTEFLDLTSLTPDEFEQLIPPFKKAFQAHMALWRLDGKPRTTRQCSLGDTPARSLAALAKRLGVSESDAAKVATPVTAAPPAPLLPMTAPRGALSAPKTLLNRLSVIAAKRKTIR